MKLSPRAFQTFWDVHAWTGVIAALLLHIMFLAGAVTLFHEQLEIWEEPLVQRAALAVGHDGKQRLLDQALAGMGERPDQFNLTLPSGSHGLPSLNYTAPGTETWRSSWVDPETGQVVPLREQLSELLYRLHFLSHESVPWLYYVAGLLAIAMLLALATGVLIHLKDLVKQFYQFRPSKGRRVLWSDMHKVLGVVGLPFQAFYAYSGAMIILGGFVLAPFVGPVFGGDQARAEAVFEGAPEPVYPPGEPAQVLSLDVLTDRAQAALPGLSLRGYLFDHHGREGGTVEVWGHVHGVAFGHGSVRLRERDGAVLGIESPVTESGGQAVKRWLYGLHFAHYGGIFLRAVLALLALGTCAVILTGNWIWLARREASRDSFGNRVLARLTAGTGAGVVVAVAALFVVSRVFPLDWAVRRSAEELTFVAVLAVCIAWALAARRGANLWWQQLGLAGFLFFLSPLLAARWSSAGLFGAGPVRIPSVVGIDLALLAVGLGLLLAARALRRAARRDAMSPRDALTSPLTAGSVPGAPVLADPGATDV